MSACGLSWCGGRVRSPCATSACGMSVCGASLWKNESLCPPSSWGGRSGARRRAAAQCRRAGGRRNAGAPCRCAHCRCGPHRRAAHRRRGAHRRRARHRRCAPSSWSCDRAHPSACGARVTSRRGAGRRAPPTARWCRSGGCRRARRGRGAGPVRRRYMQRVPATARPAPPTRRAGAGGARTRVPDARGRRSLPASRPCLLQFPMVGDGAKVPGQRRAAPAAPRGAPLPWRRDTRSPRPNRSTSRATRT